MYLRQTCQPPAISVITIFANESWLKAEVVKDMGDFELKNLIDFSQIWHILDIYGINDFIELVERPKSTVGGGSSTPLL